MEEENILSDWEGLKIMEEIYESDDLSSDYIIVDNSIANDEYTSDSDQSFIFIHGQNDKDAGVNSKNFCKKQCDTNSAQPVLINKMQKTFAEIVLTAPKVIPNPKTSIAPPIKNLEDVKVVSSVAPCTNNDTCTNVEEVCQKLEPKLLHIEEARNISSDNLIPELISIDNSSNVSEDNTSLFSLTSSQNSHYSILQNIENIQVDCLSVKHSEAEDKFDDYNKENLNILTNEIIEEFNKDVKENALCEVSSQIISPRNLLDFICFQSNENNSKSDVERHLVSAVILFLFMGFSLISSSYFVFNGGKNYQIKDDITFFKASPYYSSSLNDPHRIWVSQRLHIKQNKTLASNNSKVCYWKKMRDMLKLNLHQTMLLVDHSSARLKGSLDDNLSKINYNQPPQMFYPLSIGQRDAGQLSPQTLNLNPDCIRGQPVWLKERLSKRLNWEGERGKVMLKVDGYKPISNALAPRDVGYSILQIMNFSQSTNLYHSANTQVNPNSIIGVSESKIVRNYTTYSLTFNISTKQARQKLKRLPKNDRLLDILTLRSTLYSHKLLDFLGPNSDPYTKIETNKSFIDQNGVSNVSLPRKYKVIKGAKGKSLRSNMTEKSTALAVFGALDFPRTLNATKRIICSPVKNVSLKRANTSYNNNTCLNLDIFGTATKAQIFQISLYPRPPSNFLKMISSLTCKNSVDISKNLSLEKSLALYVPIYKNMGAMGNISRRCRAKLNSTKSCRNFFAKKRACIALISIKNKTWKSLRRSPNGTLKYGRCIAIPILAVHLPARLKLKPILTRNQTRSNFELKITKLKIRKGYELAKKIRRLIKRLERYEKIRSKNHSLINRRVKNIVFPLTYNRGKKNWFLKKGWARRIVRNYGMKKQVALNKGTPCKFVDAPLSKHGPRLPCSGGLNPCPFELQLKCPVDYKPGKEFKRCKAEAEPTRKDATKLEKRRNTLKRPPGRF